MLEFLNLYVSYQHNTWAGISKEIRLSEILSEIKNGRYQKEIEDLRFLLDIENHQSFKANKLKLPAVTFCGTFNFNRKKEDLKQYNNLIVIDIDNLSTAELKLTLEKLQNDNHVLSYWISPSNKGIKGLVPIKYAFDVTDLDIAHKSAFEILTTYFFDKYDILLDQSGSDTTRLCFLSWDNELVININCEPFLIKEHELLSLSEYHTKEIRKAKVYNTSIKNALNNPNGKNSNLDKRSMKDILIYLTKKGIVITAEYEDRYKIAYAIANTFTYDLGRIYYLTLCKIEVLKYDESKEIQLLEYCYINNAGWIGFNFIEELVKNKYNFNKKILERGVQ